MKLEEGMYVRTIINDFCNMVSIRKIELDEERENYFWIDEYVYDSYGDEQNHLCTADIKGASHKIIDLVEINDIVNGRRVIRIYEKGNKVAGGTLYSFREKVLELENDNYETFNYEDFVGNEDIKNIMTHEEFDWIKYEV